MNNTYHIIAKKEYAVEILEKLKLDGAIEDIEPAINDLTLAQKAAIDTELDRLISHPEELKVWDNIKHEYIGR